MYFQQDQDYCVNTANWAIQSQPKGDRTFDRYIKMIQAFDDELVTSLTSTRHNDQTVLVMGTSSGKVMKVSLAFSSFSPSVFFSVGVCPFSLSVCLPFSSLSANHHVHVSVCQFMCLDNVQMISSKPLNIL